MRIICDNCGAQYKIPVQKLGKRVNRATCRRCGHHIVIHQEQHEPNPEEDALVVHDDERTLVNEEPPKKKPAPVVAREEKPVSPIGAGVQLVKPTGGLNLPETLPEGPDDVDDRTVSSPLSDGIDPQKALEKLAPKVRPTPVVKTKPKAKPKNASPSSNRVDMISIVSAAIFAMLGLTAAAYGADVENPLAAMFGLGIGFSSLFFIILTVLSSDFGATSSSKVLSVGISVPIGFVVIGAVSIYGFAQPSSLTEVENVKPPPAEKVEEPKVEIKEEVEPVEEVAVAEVEPTPVTPPVVTQAPPAPSQPVTNYTPPAVITQQTTPPPAPPVVVSEPSSAPIPEPEPQPIVPEPSAPPPAANTIPESVIHTLLSSNSKVKRCFQTEYKENGTPPNNVPVNFMAAPDGKVLTAYISSGPFKGSTFETCLSAAIKSVSTPPFSGPPQQISYTFRLN